MDPFDEIEALDYSAWDHVDDFDEKLEDAGVDEPQLFFRYHEEGDIPVIDVAVEGLSNSYVDSYRLEGLSLEAFEEVGYDVWKETFEDTYGDSRPLEAFFT